MKGLKKFGALALAGTMAVSMLAGCSNSEESGGDTQTSENVSETSGNVSETSSNYDADGNWTGEISHIVMTLITAGIDPVDLQKVQDALNEISVKKEGVEVEFKPISVFDAPSQVPMWIGAKEQIDLMACSFTGISPFVDMNMIEPIEDLLAEYAPDLEEMDASGIAIYDTTKEEHTYGVRTLQTVEGRGGGYMLPQRVLEEIGCNYQNWDLITLDDLDEIFAKIKEKYPDSYMPIVGSLPAAGGTTVTDALGATAASGVLVGLDSTEVENYYATDEYYDYLQHARSWYEKGYILKDAATTDISLSDGLKNGTIIGLFTEGNYKLLDETKQKYGEEYIALMFHEPFIPSIAPQSETYWTVPVTAAEPEAAVRFLDLMMSDEEVSNLLLWGIEGEHYTISDNGKMVMTDNFANWGLPGVHGNQRIAIGNGDEAKKWDEKWDEMAEANKTKGFGFTYDASAMTNQLTAIMSVVIEYQAALETGSVDIDTVYPEFLEKLEVNGIEEIIADKQAQFDAWLAQQ